jgi:ribosome-binding factor A
MSKRGDKRPKALVPGGDLRGRSQRQLRVGEELRHRLAAAFERGLLHDPALDGVVLTVTEVKVSPDLTNATCFVVRLGGGEMDEVLKALNHAAGFLRHLVSEELGLRVSPRLAFALDRSFDAASRVEAILRHPKVARDLAQGEPPAGATATAAEDGTDDGDGADGPA